MSTSSEYNPGLAELGLRNEAGGYVGIDSNNQPFHGGV